MKFGGTALDFVLTKEQLLPSIVITYFQACEFVPWMSPLIGGMHGESKGQAGFPIICLKTKIINNILVPWAKCFGWT